MVIGCKHVWYMTLRILQETAIFLGSVVIGNITANRVRGHTELVRHRSRWITPHSRRIAWWRILSQPHKMAMAGMNRLGGESIGVLIHKCEGELQEPLIVCPAFAHPLSTRVILRMGFVATISSRGADRCCSGNTARAPIFMVRSIEHLGVL